MNHKEIYTMYLQLISIYEKSFKRSYLNQQRNDYFKGQLFMYTEDIVQKIFVLNQILKIYEERRDLQVRYCADEYFGRMSLNEET